MKYLAAYALATMGGNESPNAKDILNILGSAGLDVDMEDAKKVVNALSGKSLSEVMKAGLNKIASVPSGSTTSVAAASVATPASAPEEAKKAEEKEEPKEESDEDMGFGLFD